MKEIRFADVRFRLLTFAPELNLFVRELPSHKKDSLFEVVRELEKAGLIELQGNRRRRITADLRRLCHITQSPGQDYPWAKRIDIVMSIHHARRSSDALSFSDLEFPACAAGLLHVILNIPHPLRRRGRHFSGKALFGAQTGRLGMGPWGTMQGALE